MNHNFICTICFLKTRVMDDDKLVEKNFYYILLNFILFSQAIIAENFQCMNRYYFFHVNIYQSNEVSLLLKSYYGSE